MVHMLIFLVLKQEFLTRMGSFPLLLMIMWAWRRHQMKQITALLALCEGKPPVTGGFSSHRPGCDAELWCFLWSAPEQTLEQTIETPVIWDALVLIMTSQQWDIGPLPLKAKNWWCPRARLTDNNIMRNFGEIVIESENLFEEHSLEQVEGGSWIYVQHVNLAFLGGMWSETYFRHHNGRDSVSNHQPHDCLLNRLFRRRSKKASKLRVIGLCAGNSPLTGEFPAQMASNAENVSIWWRHHGRPSNFHEVDMPCNIMTREAIQHTHTHCSYL